MSVIFSAIASNFPRVSAIVNYFQDCSDPVPVKHRREITGEVWNFGSTVDTRLLVVGSVQGNVVEHDHEDDPVWKILWRRIPLRFRDEWLSPAEYFHGCFPWVGAPNDFWWLFRNRTCLYVTIFTKLVCLVFRDLVNTALGSFATTQYQIRQEVDTRRLNLVSFFINGQNCSPPFLKQSMYG